MLPGDCAPSKFWSLVLLLKRLQLICIWKLQIEPLLGTCTQRPGAPGRMPPFHIWRFGSICQALCSPSRGPSSTRTRAPKFHAVSRCQLVVIKASDPKVGADTPLLLHLPWPARVGRTFKFMTRLIFALEAALQESAACAAGRTLPWWLAKLGLAAAQPARSRQKSQLSQPRATAVTTAARALECSQLVLQIWDALR